MAYQQNKRLAAIEAKVPKPLPGEELLLNNKWCVEFLKNQGLDVDELKKHRRAISIIPSTVLQSLFAMLDKMEADCDAQDKDWRIEARLACK